MKIKLLILIISLCMTNFSNAQDDKLPYYEIPDHPEEYNEGTVVARMVDGLGFRYFWATEGLRDEDLSYKPSEEGRTTAETVDHLYGLTKVILNSALKLPNAGGDDGEMTFAEKRAKTLQMLKQAADIFRSSEDLSEFTLVFARGENTSEFPFWNNINGPIADAIWHCGQVVLLRRASGNPFNSNASVFSGKVKQ